MIESGVENVPLHAGGGKIRPIDVVMGKRTYQLMWEHKAPPLGCKVLTSDAAGWKFKASGGDRVGMGCVGLDEEGEIFYGTRTHKFSSVTESSNTWKVKQQAYNSLAF